MATNNDKYEIHKGNIKGIIRQDNNLHDIEKKYIQTIAGYVGHETSIDGALERLEYLKDLIERYKEENKFQNSRTTNVGFDIS
jgi:membrane-bound lytic murein transglycosylase MltF